MTQGYVPDKDPAKTRWGDIKDAKPHLLAIKQTDPEYAEAQQLLTEVKRREAAIAKLMAVVEAQLKLAAREQFRENAKRSFLSKGMDVNVTLGGKDKTTATFTYVLFTEATAYQAANQTDLLSSMKGIGFKRAVFADGYGKSWTYELK
jgi:biotin-(acetyl-CoA carboxylase) ligase